jgi:hypothetical protein
MNRHLHVVEYEPPQNQDARDAEKPGKHIFHKELLSTELVRLQRCISMANAFGDVVKLFMSGAHLDAMNQGEPILITAETNGRVHSQCNGMPPDHNMHGDEERNKQASGYSQHQSYQTMFHH